MALSYGFCLDEPDKLYSSKDFSDAFQAVFGNGITDFGSQFSLSVSDGFDISIGPGYAMVQGRWVKNDDSINLTIQPSSNNKDRYDALVIVENEDDRSASVEIATDLSKYTPRVGTAIVGISSLGEAEEIPNHIRPYLFYVRQGETSLEESDIKDTRANTDTCGYIIKLSELSGDVNYVFNFFNSEISKEVARLVALTETSVNEASKAVAEIDAKISKASGTSIGDIVESLSRPLPTVEWLLCDGSRIPSQYSRLIEAIGANLPLLFSKDERYKKWIYAGAPA